MKSTRTPRYQELTSRLKSARKGADLTQQELADRLGKPQSYVSKYESGERRLDVAEFMEVATALGLDAPLLLTHSGLPLTSRRKLR